MRNPFKILAGYCVTAYAKRTYNQAVKMAEKQYTTDKRRQYVISHPLDFNKLIVVNSRQFRAFRAKYNLPHLNHGDLPKGAWYYTAGEKGNDAIPNFTKLRRMNTFIHELLVKAKLA